MKLLFRPSEFISIRTQYRKDKDNVIMKQVENGNLKIKVVK